MQAIFLNVLAIIYHVDSEFGTPKGTPLHVFFSFFGWSAYVDSSRVGCFRPMNPLSVEGIGAFRVAGFLPKCVSLFEFLS